MTIYDIKDNKIIEATLTEGAEHEEELGKTNLVRLSWQSDVKITLPAGAYIVPFDDGLKYRLLNSYTPTEDSNGFKYAPEFHHPLMWLSRVPFLYETTDSEKNTIKQQEWSYDGLTTNALEYACKAINEALGLTENKFTYTLCGNVDSSVSFSVSSNDILSVLSSIAQACKDNSCEWHLSWKHKTLYFGQISINLGENVPTLKVHENIQTASVNGNKEEYYNCFYPQGSTKNMSRKALVGTGNVATLARLGLNKDIYPDGYIYISPSGEVITKSAFESINAPKQTLALSFDEIYPHIDLYAYNIRKRTRYLKNEQTKEVELDSQGNKKTYTIWYMRLAYPTTIKEEGKAIINTTQDKDKQGKAVTYYWYDYELDKKKQILQGHTLKGTFKVNTHATNNQYDALTQPLVGQPNGQDGFELRYHEVGSDIPANPSVGDSGVNVSQGDYEIVKYQSGDTIIPTNESEGLYPRGKDKPDFTCNIVVLFNIVMGERETKAAQEELAARTIKEINRRTQDNNNYTTHSNAVEFAKSNPNLYIGKKVIFDDGQGYQLATRVLRLVTKLDYPIIQEITVGNQAVKGTISQLKEDVNNILSGNFSGGGLNSSQVGELIKNYVDNRFLRKDTPDTAQELITFLNGIAFKNGGIDGAGRAELLSIIAEALKSYDFNSATESGFGVTKRKDGKYQFSITDLVVWGKAVFNELEKRKLSYVGGNMVFSSCGSKIKKVVPISADGREVILDNKSDIIIHSNKILTANRQILYYQTKKSNIPISAYRCYFHQDDGTTATTNLWEAGDQARCQTFNIKEGKYKGVSNRHYWRLVKKVGEDYIDLSVNDCEEGSDIPQVGDALVQFGSRTNTDRMSLIYVVVNGDDAPAIIWYDGVNSYTLRNKRTAIVSPKEVTFHTRMFNLLNDDGTTESISSIKQTTEGIEIEVKKQAFSGVNLLKGASLRALNVLSLEHSEYVAIGTHTPNSHRNHPYIYIVRHGATQDEFNGCKFPIINLDSQKTYTFSAFTRIFGADNPYLEIKLSKQKDMTGAKVVLENIPSTYGKWKQYSHTFDIKDYLYIQIFIGLKRDGEAFFSEIQLEEGFKATTWKDPDIVESIERAGIHINGADMSINAQANRFNFLDQQNNIVASVDNDGAIQGLKFCTRNNGAGYIDLTGSMMSVFGAVAKNIEFGIDEKGQAILKFYDNAGNNTLNLSPDGIKAENITTATFSPLEVCYIGAVGNVNLNNPSDTIFDKFFTFNKPNGTNVYLYTGAKIGGNYIADTEWGKQEVEENSGRYFKKARATNDNTVINGVYAAALPMFEGNISGGVNAAGYATELSKKMQTITVYVFRNGNIQTIPMHRVIIL